MPDVTLIFNYRRLFVAISAVLLSAGLMLFGGCSMAHYGGLKHNRDVAQAFETFHVYGGHRYYYLNQENNPYAVVALQNDYTLTGKMWTEFDPRSEMLEKIVGLVKGFPVNYSYPYGARLLDRQGNSVGYWYSSLQMVGVRVDNKAHTVFISTETPWLWDDWDSKFRDLRRPVIIASSQAPGCQKQGLERRRCALTALFAMKPSRSGLQTTSDWWWQLQTVSR